MKRSPGMSTAQPQPTPMPVVDGMTTLREKLDLGLEAIAAKNFQKAAELLDPEALPRDAEIPLKIEWASALYTARAHDQSDALFGRMLTQHPGDRSVHVAFAKQLYHAGFLRRAHDVLNAVSDQLAAGSKSLSLFNRTKHLLSVLEDKEGVAPVPHDDCRLLAMKHATLAFRGRDASPLQKDEVGRITLITGSLGPGGAERQLSRTAAQLERWRSRGEAVAGVMVKRQVEVLVRSHGPEQEHDFFLPDLLDANVALGEINKMEPMAPSKFDISDADLRILLEYLPPKVNFGIRRLVPHLLKSRPDVVSIWQDGACLFAALAAIIAGVPKIQLAIRGLPPSQRRHLFQPEYEQMYRTLAQVPGVQFLSNSKAAAQAYAEWLEIPVERFDILYNGVGKMESHSSPDVERQWADFVTSTPDADHTIGGVFRFDTDKRPATWIRFAARYFRKHPNS
ncbi:MAG: hypothetical protein KDE63_12620, partial [Novosphingobium sp.]|nr:hypothetical protein [Novosphingobium sp.]